MKLTYIDLHLTAKVDNKTSNGYTVLSDGTGKVSQLTYLPEGPSVSCRTHFLSSAADFDGMPSQGEKLEYQEYPCTLSRIQNQALFRHTDEQQDNHFNSANREPY